MPQPHIQIILADDVIPPTLQTALQRTGASAAFAPLSEAVRSDRTARADAVVVIVPENTAPLAGPLRVLFDQLAEHPRATLVLRGNGTAVPPLAHPSMLPVSFSTGDDEHDLGGRLSTMLGMRSSLDSMHRSLMHQRRSGESLARRYVNQLRLASQLQREFLPEELPRFDGVSFDVLFRPVDYVSGDIYDVHRLDEEHVGLALADATGHGIPAALLTVYIKRALRGKEIENGSYRILAPDEVLQRLNEDLLEAHLTECPFVAAVYGVLNLRTRELTIARGGAPFPILRAADGETRMITSAGSVVGVLPESRFETTTVHLNPGDCVLLYSDGLERIVSPEEAGRNLPAGLRKAASRLARVRRSVANAHAAAVEPQAELVTAGVAVGEDMGGATDDAVETDKPQARSTGALFAEPREQRFARNPSAAHTGPGLDPVAESAWFDTLRTHGPAIALEQVAGRQRALRRMGYPLDDLTVLSVQIEH